MMQTACARHSILSVAGEYTSGYNSGYIAHAEALLTEGPAPQLANALNAATTSSSDAGMSLHACV